MSELESDGRPNSDIKEAAVAALRQILTERDAPAAARASAARTLLEAVGIVGAKADKQSRIGGDATTPAAGLSDAELSAAIARLASAKSL